MGHPILEFQPPRIRTLKAFVKILNQDSVLNNNFKLRIDSRMGKTFLDFGMTIVLVS
jgi:hypothetical protein